MLWRMRRTTSQRKHGGVACMRCMRKQKRDNSICRGNTGFRCCSRSSSTSSCCPSCTSCSLDVHCGKAQCGGCGKSSSVTHHIGRCMHTHLEHAANSENRWVVQYKFVVAGGWSITIGLAVIYAFTPLLIFFEPDPPMPDPNIPADPTKTPGVHDTGLMIPCYKSENIVGATLEAAIKIFPPSHIFVIANGNSPTPLDNTEAVCQKYGVNHVWSPVGSKIVAQFVGCYAMKGFKNVLLIDDDCALPPNFPIVSDRMKGKVGCLGYTIKSVGPNSSKGTLAQRAQDLEYKISGLQRALAGKIGSATFPHGAISLWNREFLLKTFHTHPGFSVSEDWFFGHVARQLGCRIKMCTSVFVETETPDSVFVSSGGSRGGFGEMTIFKQRFSRWNFFFIYETLLYLIAPFMLPISFIVRPVFSGTLFSATFGLYFLNVTIFNEIHLRRKHERVDWVCVYLYYMPYKILLTAINVASCYWSLYKYAKYFAKRHPKIIEDEKAVEVVLRLEESGAEAAATVLDKDTGLPKPSVEGGRRMTITAIGTRLSVVEHNADLEPQISKVTSRRSSRSGRRPSGARRSNSIANRYSISYDTKNSFDRPTYGDEIEPDSELARRLRAMEQRQQSVAQSVSGPKPTTAAVDFAAGSFGAPSPASPMERVHENFELGPSDFTSHLEQVREDVEEPDEEFPRPYNTAAVDFGNASPSPFDRLHEALSLPPRPPLGQALEDAELGPRDNRRKTSFARSPV
ncbi:nucleotide-diphospho-sugar transferase [Cryomyces antarcticus]